MESSQIPFAGRVTRAWAPTEPNVLGMACMWRAREGGEVADVWSSRQQSDLAVVFLRWNRASVLRGEEGRQDQTLSGDGEVTGVLLAAFCHPTTAGQNLGVFANAKTTPPRRQLPLSSFLRSALDILAAMDTEDYPSTSSSDDDQGASDYTGDDATGSAPPPRQRE